MNLPLIDLLPGNLEESLIQAADQTPWHYADRIVKNTQFILEGNGEEKKKIIRKLHFLNVYITIDEKGISISHDEISDAAFNAPPSYEIDDDNREMMEKFFMKLSLHNAGWDNQTSNNIYPYHIAKAKFQLPSLEDMRALLDALQWNPQKWKDVYTLFTQWFGMQDGEYILDIEPWMLDEWVLQVLSLHQGEVKIINQPKLLDGDYMARVRPLAK